MYTPIHKCINGMNDYCYFDDDSLFYTDKNILD